LLYFYTSHAIVLNIYNTISSSFYFPISNIPIAVIMAALDPRFKISEASVPEMEEVMIVLQKAYANDATWKPIFTKCTPAAVHKWVMEVLVPRWTMPDIKTFKVEEVSSGYL
jgi:hypothetical protein